MNDQDDTSPINDWLTVAEAALLLNVSERFIRRLIAERRITYYHFGKFVRLNREDCRTFASAERIEALR